MGFQVSVTESLSPSKIITLLTQASPIVTFFLTIVEWRGEHPQACELELVGFFGHAGSGFRA